MSRIADYLFSISVCFWVGGLWAIGYIVAPTLFNFLPDRSLAGALAGSLFTAIAWVGMGCSAYLLLFLALRKGAQALRSTVFWLVVVMLMLTLAGYFGVQPVIAQLKADAWPREVMESVLRDRFRTWHGISSVLYLIQSVLGIALVTQTTAPR